ncbi:type I-E CRISPR-associated protein Cse2/CasB [Propionibacterium freudenreichii]|nr:type I-E CRISPR-associated protein Cse2/CasB [Propionibacterium freudenreichii]MCT2978005.1 type I-E CRISPR-associated protein Cse2/CasB [Propionibacterium freudenreichii]MCT2981434.1 type I-E CRISPR-associated protein Cse2/CasB [Propionibacterium freudenreichii]MCT2983929.1 type I-E CRISPR-associated protein Cse2/CasB [Propionibacterium freudenreichii]MCT2987512.1 type I-E CRISPR-associated protein Cse2/CasB [Propionibacterium freudenreichii]
MESHRRHAHQHHDSRQGAVMTHDAAKPQDPGAVGHRPARLAQLYGAAVGPIEIMQRSYLAHNSFGTERLATLRHADVTDPASNPRLWAMTLSNLPDEFIGPGEVASQGELALHAALVLYATHQQAQTRPMHTSAEKVPPAERVKERRRVSFGHAVRRLAQIRGTGGQWDAGSITRFEALSGAHDHAARVVALRRLITLLRGEAIPLDYGQLACDLYDLNDARRRAEVQLRWGRDLHRKLPSDDQPAVAEASAQADANRAN